MSVNKLFIFIAAFILPIILYCQETMIKAELVKKYSIDVDVDYKYILELPPNVAGNELIPLIVFLHGSGERGDAVDLVQVHGPWEFIENHPQYRFAILAPQCKQGEFWDPRNLSLLLDDITDHYPIDTNRIYLTGLSMGGYGTWDWAIFSPERFAAIAPVCGATNLHEFMAHKVKNLPIWVFHGAMDESVPLDFSTEVVKKLKDLGADVQFTIYPFTGHNAWDQAYEDEELYKWFLAHQKK